MCLIVFSYKLHPNYPFILAGNRDEFYKRPTQPAHRWKTEPVIYAGKDLKDGGTWLGFTDTGRFAALTNFRDMKNLSKTAPSRGEIVTSFLLSKKNVEDTLQQLNEKADLYNGFNLIAGTFDKLFYLSNQKDEIEEINPGIHAISNAYLNTPWPKTTRAHKQFKNVLASDELDENAIFDLLKDTTRYPIDVLPKTGLPDEMECAVSSAFIQTEDYGTRSTSIIMVDQQMNAKLIEHTYEPGTLKVINREKLTCQLTRKDVQIG